MRLLQNRRERRRLFTFSLVVLCLLAWVGAAVGADSRVVPALAWNLSQIESLKVPEADTLTFAVLGDSQSNPEVFGQALQQLACSPSLAFAIQVGDLVQRCSAETLGSYLRQVRQNLRLPWLTVVGNHDLEEVYGPRLYREIFGPDYYSFQVGDNYFILVDDVERNGVSETQWRWLEKELRQSLAFKTRLVFLHVPLFDPRGGKKHHCLNEEMGRKLSALFHQYQVTHIFTGHIHGYFSGNWEGVPYTITGGAGGKLYGTDPQHFFHHYLKVTIRGNKVHVEVQRLAAEESVKRYD